MTIYNRMAGIINSFLSLLENNYQDEFNNQNNKLKKHSMYSTRNLGCVQNFNVEHRPEKSHPKASSADLRLVTLMKLSMEIEGEKVVLTALAVAPKTR